MSNISTTSNSLNPLPLTNERKNNVPVLDTPENIKGRDTAGYFDQDPVVETFDANGRGKIIFNFPEIDANTINSSPDKTVPSSTLSEMFGGSDKWVSITPAKIVNAVANTASTIINAAGISGSDFKDAGLGLLQELALKPDNNADAANINPDAVTKKQEEAQKQAEYLENRQQEEGVEAQISRVRQKLALIEQQKPIRQEVAKLTDLPEWVDIVDDETGEVRIDLQKPLEQRRKEMMENQKKAKGPIVSASKQGGQGQELSNKDIDSGEHQGHTAQTAVG